MTNTINSIALAALLASLVSSCAPTTTVTQGATRVPVAQRVTLDSSVTGNQKTRIRESASSQFGGFEVGQWGRSGVIGAIIVSANGVNGSNGYYDRRGTYNLTSTGAFSMSCASGKVAITAKPNHYQIPGSFDNQFEFQANPGHDYFIGYIVDEAHNQLRWVPVVYDKSKDQNIPLKGISPRSVSKPSQITLYL